MTPEALARLHAAAFNLDRPWSAREFRDMLAQPGVLVLGDEAAFLMGRVASDEAEVLTVATAPPARRTGLARDLLAAFHAEAARLGATRALLEVAEDNAPAIALYEGAGYGRVGRRPAYYARRPAPAVAALVLARDLP